MKRIVWLMVFIMFVFAVPSVARDLFSKVREESASQGNAYASARILAIADTGSTLRTVYLKYANAESVQKTLSTILNQGEGISVNQNTNSLVIRGAARNLDRMEAVIGQLDKIPLQVQVEAKILEIKTGNGDTNTPSSFGWSWQYYNSPGSNKFVQFFGTAVPTADAQNSGLYAQVMSSQLNAYLQALDKKGAYDIVASPTIMALNNQEATIFIGGKLGYRNLLTTTTGTLQEIQFLESGTKLVFTPQINEDGFIKLTIYPSISEGALTADGLPVINTTESKNMVVVKDGQTVVIGGLTKNFRNKVEIGIPYLSQIPLLGSFFRRTEIVQEKRDIMVLITPHIVTPELVKALNEKAEKAELKTNDHVDDTKLIY